VKRFGKQFVRDGWGWNFGRSRTRIWGSDLTCRVTLVGSKQGGGRLSASLSETDRQRQFIAEGFRRACEEFRAEVEKQCNDCNHEPEIGNILETEFSTKGGTVVRRDIATEMKIVFDSALFKICIKCENPIKLIYSITVKPCAEKSDWRYVNGCGDSVKADYIVGMGIDALLGISSHVH